MSYVPGTLPKNFKEYEECYKNELVVRRLFPRKYFNITDGNYKKEFITNDKASIRTYSSICVDTGYQIRETDKPSRECIGKNRCYNQICATEDYILFHGDKENYIKGLSEIAITERTGNLFTAIEKYKPSHVIANRSSLKNILVVNFPYVECQFVENGVYYLFPEITPDIAEFVIWKDVYEDPVPFRQQGGSNLYNIYEWVAIAIHEPEKFVKVV